MSELCVDERAAVRKSACQTLFSTLSAHGSLLQSTTWTDVLWQVWLTCMRFRFFSRMPCNLSYMLQYIYLWVLYFGEADNYGRTILSTLILTLPRACRCCSHCWMVLPRRHGRLAPAASRLPSWSTTVETPNRNSGRRHRYNTAI